MEVLDPSFVTGHLFCNPLIDIAMLCKRNCGLAELDGTINVVLKFCRAVQQRQFRMDMISGVIFTQKTRLPTNVRLLYQIPHPLHHSIVLEGRGDRQHKGVYPMSSGDPGLLPM